MTNPLLKKIGVKEGMRSILVNVPSETRELFDPELEEAASDQLTGSFDYIHLFVKDCAQLDHTFPQLKDRLKLDGMLWISWPKGKRLGTDLTLQNIIKIGYNHGLVESKTIGVDATWSAIKFTFPKQGKQYNNSYGKLK